MRIFTIGRSPPCADLPSVAVHRAQIYHRSQSTVRIFTIGRSPPCADLPEVRPRLSSTVGVGQLDTCRQFPQVRLRRFTTGSPQNPLPVARHYQATSRQELLTLLTGGHCLRKKSSPSSSGYFGTRSRFVFGQRTPSASSLSRDNRSPSTTAWSSSLCFFSR